VNSKTITLGEICFIEKGKIGIQAAIPGDFPLVTTAAERGSHNEYHFKGEAVCIPLVSATGHGHASLKRIHFQRGKFCVGNILCACIPKDYRRTSAKFLHLYFSLLKDVILVPLMQGSANVSLKIKDLEKVEVPDVSFERQLEIVNEFERLEAINKTLLTELDQQQTYLHLLRQTILQEAVQGKLTRQYPTDEPATDLLKRIKAEKANLIKVGKLKKEKELAPITEAEIPFELSEGWVWCRFGEAVYKITDGFHNTPARVREGVPYVMATHIKSEGIDFDNCSYVSQTDHKELWAKAFPQKGEILLVNIGAGCGTPAIIDVDFEFSFKNSAIIKQPKEIDTHFLFYYLISIREKVYNEVIQGGAQPYLSLKMINHLIFPLPPLAEQQRIVAKVQQLQQQLSQLEAQVQQSRQYAQKLLQMVLKEAFENKEKAYEEEDVLTMAAEE
jgi:type I restriction enzyme, S subunit